MLFHDHSTVDRPPGEVFDLRADLRNEVVWNPQVSRSELTSAGAVGLGSTFTTVNRGSSFDATISAYDRPGLVAFHVTGGGQEIITTFRFSQQGSGTSVDSAFDFRPHGFMKLVFPLLTRSIRAEIPRQAAQFRAFCEQSAPTT